MHFIFIGFQLSVFTVQTATQEINASALFSYAVYSAFRDTVRIYNPLVYFNFSVSS